jgi:hypothetical protein
VDEAAKRKADSLHADSLRKDSIALNYADICSSGMCVMVPRHFVPVNNINPDATLQFADAENEEYLIIIEEDKAAFLDSVKYMDYYSATATAAMNYREYWNVNMVESLDSMYNVTRSRQGKSTEVQLLKFTGNLPTVPEPVVYTMGFVEGKTKMYVITAWTLLSYNEKNDAELTMTVSSFREQ